MASLVIGFTEGARIPMTVYEMRTYTVQVGKMPEAIRLYSQFGYPALHKGGFDKKLVGYFISDTGTLHQLVHLWKFDDYADQRAHWAALFADTRFYRRVCRPVPPVGPDPGGQAPDRGAVGGPIPKQTGDVSSDAPPPPRMSRSSRSLPHHGPPRGGTPGSRRALSHALGLPEEGFLG